MRRRTKNFLRTITFAQITVIIYSIILSLMLKNLNSEFIIFLAIFSMTEIEGIIIIILMKLNMLNPVVEKMRKTKKASEIDAMTGLYNRRKFETRIDLYNQSHSISAFFLDANNLKLANDQYGHDAGDELLIKIAEKMLQIENPNVDVYRFGGDEFVIIVRNIDKSSSEKMFCNLIKNIEQINLELADIKVSVAYGIAFSNRKIDIENLVNKADEEMYRCKCKQKATKAD